MVYVVILYATLPFMRQLLNFLKAIFGVETLSLCINSLSVFAAISIIFLIIKKGKKSYFNAAIILIILIMCGFVAINLEIPEERVHFLEYGILGYLVLNATINSWSLPVFSSFIIVSMIGGGDEIIQWFLPSRVGDMRDVFMNSFGGLMGVTIGRLWNDRA